MALPQLPERRRPDRNLAGAHAARDRVLARMVSAGLIDQHEADRAAAEERRRRPPARCQLLPLTPPVPR